MEPGWRWPRSFARMVTSAIRARFVTADIPSRRSPAPRPIDASLSAGTAATRQPFAETARIQSSSTPHDCETAEVVRSLVRSNQCPRPATARLHAPRHRARRVPAAKRSRLCSARVPIASRTYVAQPALRSGRFQSVANVRESSRPACLPLSLSRNPQTESPPLSALLGCCVLRSRPAMSATLQRDHWNGMTKSNSLTKPQRLMLSAAIQLLRQYTVEAERYKVERAAITYGHRHGANRQGVGGKHDSQRCKSSVVYSLRVV